MPKKFDVCFGVRYQGRDGEQTRWSRHGAVIEKDGKFYLKMDSFPAPGQDGWFFSLFPPKQKTQQQAPSSRFDDEFDDGPPFQ